PKNAWMVSPCTVAAATAVGATTAQESIRLQPVDQRRLAGARLAGDEYRLTDGLHRFENELVLRQHLDARQPVGLGGIAPGLALAALGHDLVLHLRQVARKLFEGAADVHGCR